MNIGDALKLVRRSCSLTQTELGKRLDVSQMLISQYEKGIRTPKAETIQKIAFAILKEEKDFDYEVFESLSKEAEHDDSIKILVQAIIKKLKENNPNFFSALQESITPILQSQRQTAFINYLYSLGYELVDGALYDAPYHEVGMIQVKKDNVEIPLSQGDFEKLKQSIENNVELEIYRLRKDKGI